MGKRFERWRRSGWWAYLFAITFTGFTAYLFIFGDAASYAPLGLALLFAVVVSAFAGGLWPGLLSTLIVAVPLKLMFDGRWISVTGVPTGPPILLFWFPIVFGLMGCIVSVLFEALHRSRRASNAARGELNAILANISDAIVTTDVAGRIEYVNKAAAMFLQLDPQDIIGQPFESVVRMRDTTNAPHSQLLLERVRSTGHTVHAGDPQVLLRSDGTQLAIDATAAPVCDSAGNLIAVQVTIRDCTEQRQAERMLHERLALQAKLERIAAVVPGALHEFRMSPDNRRQIPYVNRYFKEIFGVEPASLTEDAAHFFAMAHPDDLERVRSAREASRRDLTPINTEYRVLTPHRGVRWVALSAMPLREADGGTHWHGVFMDVTERKQAEERLRASQLQLHEALEAGDMGLLMIDLSTEVVEMDVTARRLWNLQSVTAPVLTVGHLLDAIHPDSRESAREDYRQMAGGVRAYSSEYHIGLNDGMDRWLLCRGRIYADEATGHLVRVGVIIDTTHQRRKEQQRLHSQKLEALGVLAGGVAHDFNNLLLAIAGNARLLLEDLPVTDPMRTSVQEIDKAAARAAELVRRILSFSSLPDSTQVPSATALGPVLNEVLGLARAVLPATVSIHSSIADDLPAVTADSNQVHQALINLLTNAADAIEAAPTADGVIALRVDVVRIGAPFHDAPAVQPGSYVRIAVSDRGNGIDYDLQQRIFDPFFTTKPAGKGTGLGLATVHGIMKRIDGAVTVSSMPGQGATFSLYFPVQNHSPMADVPRAKVRAGGHKAHILYVDDEESLVFLMTRTLQRMGHNVTACAEPEEALAVFKANADDFDLVVSDMAMPGMSGLELAVQMLAIRPQLPFVITSGYVDAAAMARAQEIGVRQMIMKPNTVDELSEVLSAVLKEQNMA